MTENSYRWPITPKYIVTEHDKYGVRKNHYVLFKQRQHSGFDITADIGTPVHPIMSGIVLTAEFDGTTTEGFDAFNDGYGNKVEILNDDGRRVIYAHLRQYIVKKGDRVTQDTIIGKTGCSGGSRVPHLHIEIRKENTDKTGLDNTLNPLDVLPKFDFSSLKEEFKMEPYAKLWKIMSSENPWGFTKNDISYAEDPYYIK